MDSEQRLKDLSQKLEGTVNRINEIEAKPSFGKRVVRHLKSQGGNITNVILAGVLFSVAMGKLGQKQEFAAEKDALSEQIRMLETKNNSLQEEVDKLQFQKRNMQSLVQRELDNGGWRLQPVASRIKASVLDQGDASATGPHEEPLIPVQGTQESRKTAEVKKPQMMI